MANKCNLALKIQRLKPAPFFVVETEEQRQEALKTGHMMRDAGMISFQVTSRKIRPGELAQRGWKVLAI